MALAERSLVLAENRKDEAWMNVHSGCEFSNYYSQTTCNPTQINITILPQRKSFKSKNTSKPSKETIY